MATAIRELTSLELALHSEAKVLEAGDAVGRAILSIDRGGDDADTMKLLHGAINALTAAILDAGELTSRIREAVERAQ